MATKFDNVRDRIMNDCRVLFEGLQFDVLRTGSQELCLPIVNEDGDENYLVITFKIPKGSRDGDPYDGYAVAEDYKIKCNLKKEKAKVAAEKKAKKIERDKKMREAKLEAKKKRGDQQKGRRKPSVLPGAHVF